MARHSDPRVRGKNARLASEAQNPDSLTYKLREAWKAIESGQPIRAFYMDPDKIAALAVTDPIQALMECQKGLILECQNEHVQKRRLICAVYAAAYHLKNNETELKRFDFQLCFNHHTKKEDLEDTKNRLIFLVFKIGFLGTQTTENTRYRYAYGLETYLAANAEPAQVKSLVMKLGSEKLYDVAVERKKTVTALRLYQDAGRDPNSIIDETYFFESAQGDESTEASAVFEVPAEEDRAALDEKLHRRVEDSPETAEVEGSGDLPSDEDHADADACTEPVNDGLIDQNGIRTEAGRRLVATIDTLKAAVIKYVRERGL